MAYRRSISTTATVFSRKLQPLFTPIFHAKNDLTEFDIPSLCPSQSPVRTILAFGLCNKTTGVGSLFRERIPFSFVRSVVLGGSFYRHMSSTIGEGDDKVNDMGYVAELVTGKTMESAASQGPVVSEVAVAASDSSFPVAFLQHLVDAIHSFTGFNWWASIALTTILIEVAVTPLLIKERKAIRSILCAMPHLKRIRKLLVAGPYDIKALNVAWHSIKRIGVPVLTHWGGVLIRFSIRISFILGIRNMAAKVPSFETGGALWFLDLTTPDSLLILPVLTSLTFWLTSQVFTDHKPARISTKIVIPIIALLCLTNCNKALFFYFLPASFYSMMLPLALRSAEARKLLGFPGQAGSK